ncbi:hypothetical protein [Microbacterium xylanilyticum]
MAVTLAAVLLTASNPRPVQITLNGTTAGQAYEIRGTTADGSSWPVPGGKGTSAGTQVVVVDNRAALNVAVTYTVLVAGATYSAAPVTVTWSGVGVLQTLSGKNIVDIEVASVTEPQKHGIRASTFEIAGRSTPAARLDVPGSAITDWLIDTQQTDTAALRAILATGTPVVRRLTPGMRDFQTVVIGVVLSWHDELLTGGGDTWRRFTLQVHEISDPQPSALLAAYLWDNFDQAMAKPRVWSYHSTLSNVAGLTAGNGTLSSQATGGYPDGSGTTFGRLTVTTAATFASVIDPDYTKAAVTLGAPVVPGMVVTLTARVRAPAGRAIGLWLMRNGGIAIASVGATATGAWQQLACTGTVPSGATGLSWDVWANTSGLLAGDTLDFDAITFSQGATIPVGSFDEMFATWDQFDAADWALFY